MSEFRNCLTTTTSPVAVAQITNECCTSCQSNMKDNCTCEGCSGLVVQCSSIENAVCLPILADQIFDSISMQKDDIGSLGNLTFNLDSINTNYVVGQPVCIKKIGLSYDFIGLDASILSNNQIVINGQTFTLIPTSLYNTGSVNLFNELNGTITLQLPCCCETPTQPGIKLRTIERNRSFLVSNLKIVVSGVIGCTSFTATADTLGLMQPTTNLIPLSVFAISNMTFVGKICWPNNNNRMTLNEEFDTNLILDCITPTSNYTAPVVEGNPGLFTANIDISFTANKKIYASNKGPIAVFTTPNATISKNGEIIDNCMS